MKLVDNQANIQAIRKISTLFEMTAMEVDELLGTVMETARAIVGAKNASLLLMQNEKTKKLQSSRLITFKSVQTRS